MAAARVNVPFSVRHVQAPCRVTEYRRAPPRHSAFEQKHDKSRTWTVKPAVSPGLLRGGTVPSSIHFITWNWWLFSRIHG